MISLLAQALIWSALTALPVILLTLLIGHLRVPARLKVWACRLSFLKLAIGVLPLGVFVARPVLSPAVAQATSNPRFDLLLAFLTLLWVIGLGVVIGDLVHGYRESRRLRRDAQIFHSADMERLAERCGIATPEVRMGLTEGLPLATGVFRPVIVLPTQPCSDSVLAHELAHIRERDLLWNLLARIVLGVFWFVPFIHRLETELGLWQEAVADAEACRIAGCDLASHAAAIVQSVSPVTSRLIWDARLSGDGQMVKRRLLNLYQVRGSLTIAAAGGLALVLSLLPLRVAATTPQREAASIRTPLAPGGPGGFGAEVVGSPMIASGPH